MLKIDEEFHEESRGKLLIGSDKKRKVTSRATRDLVSDYDLVGASGLEPLTPTV
jgi:hypothetical protein